MKVKLTDICNPKQWKTIPTSELKSEGYPVYGANGIIGYYNSYNHEKITIAITCRGATCGTVNLACPKSYITGNAMCLDEVDESVDLKYLYYAMKSYDFSKVISGTAQPQITREGLQKVEIAMQSIEKQRSIVSKLDTVEAILVKRKQQLAKLDQLVKSRFIELFGEVIVNSKNLPTMPLGKVCYLKAGTTTSADEIFDYSTETPIPCYGGNGIRGYVKKATQNGEYPIIGRQGALCGNVQFATGEFHATEHAVIVKSLHEDNIVWLCYVLKYLDLYRYHTGAAQPGLSVKVLNTIDIPIAEKELQNQFAAFVSQVDKSKLAVQKSLEALETLKKSLMQQYFG